MTRSHPSSWLPRSATTFAFVCFDGARGPEVDDVLRARAAIDVVAHEHYRVLGFERRQLRHDLEEVIGLAVNVTDCEGASGHWGRSS